jgi:hypothetical protein
MTPGAETRVRLEDRLGVTAVTYVLFGVKLGPALALSVVLVFAIWIGWRCLCRNIEQSPLAFRVRQAARSPLLTLGREPSALCLDAMMADAVRLRPSTQEAWSVVYGATSGSRMARESSNLAGESKPAAGVVNICRGVPYRRTG